MNTEMFDLAGQVLDHLVVDANDYPCGKVDDVEIAGELGQALRIAAILVGSSAWMARLPSALRLTAEKFVRPRITRVPWRYVEQVTPKVKLRLPAEALDLGTADTKAARLMARWLAR